MNTTIGRLAEAGILAFGDGYRTKRSEHGQPGFRILRVADVHDGSVSLDGPDFVADRWASQIGPKLSQAGDVLVTTKGTVGRVAIMPETAEVVTYSPQLCYFRVNREDMLNPRWLSYWFKSPSFAQQASHRANNTDMAPYINLTDVRSLVLPPTPIEEQRAIAEVLGALDDKIAANVALESSADSLIEALFGAAVAREDAQQLPLMAAVKVEFGEAFKGDSFSEVGVGRPLIRIRDLKTFTSQTWTTERRSREVVVEPGNVLIGMDAEFRPTWWLGEPGVMNQRVLRASADAGAAFVRQALIAPMRRVEGYKTGTTVIHLNKSDLDREHVDWPSRAAIDKFAPKAEAVLATRVASAAERRRLAETRDALLPGLMSGKLRVKDAERAVEAAV